MTIEQARRVGKGALCAVPTRMGSTWSILLSLPREGDAKPGIRQPLARRDFLRGYASLETPEDTGCPAFAGHDSKKAPRARLTWPNGVRWTALVFWHIHKVPTSVSAKTKRSAVNSKHFSAGLMGTK